MEGEGGRGPIFKSGTTPVFAYLPRETLKNLDRVAGSENRTLYLIRMHYTILARLLSIMLNLQ